jgi:hypothetical protein
VAARRRCFLLGFRFALTQPTALFVLAVFLTYHFSVIQEDKEMKTNLLPFISKRLHILGMLLLSFFMAPCNSIAQGPTGIGDVRMGMSKAEYLLAVGLKNPIDCDKEKNVKKGSTESLGSSIFAAPVSRRDISCYGSGKSKNLLTKEINKRGTIANVQIEGISYDVIKNGHDSEFLRSIGNVTYAIFLEDRLVNLEIFGSKINVETLTHKYGPPKMVEMVGNKKIEVRQNRIGNMFGDGAVGATWNNGGIDATLWREYRPLLRSDLLIYTLEETKSVKLIDEAIEKFKISRKIMVDTPF